MPKSKKKKISDEIQPSHTRMGTASFMSWDFLRPCLGKKCKLAARCVHSKKRGAACHIERVYLQNIYESLHPMVLKIEDSITLNIIGLQLIPMYHQLCKLMIEEAAVTTMFVTTNAGRPYAHPIYREIRETQRLITDLWRNSGLQKMARDLGHLTVGAPMTSLNVDRELEGDPEYYRQMSGEG